MEESFRKVSVKPHRMDGGSQEVAGLGFRSTIGARATRGFAFLETCAPKGVGRAIRTRRIKDPARK